MEGVSVKLFTGPARMPALAGLLACVLLSALTPGGAAALGAHPAADSGIKLPAAGFGHASKKTVVNLRDLSAAESRAAGGHPATAAAVTTAARSALTPLATTAAQATAAAAAAPVTSSNFPGLQAIDGATPPDPNAAMSPTQIVEVVNTRMQVYTRGGSTVPAPPST
jgi:hypothetical protein